MALILLGTSAAFAGVSTPSLSAQLKSASSDGDAAYAFGNFGSSGLTVHKISVQGLVAGDVVTAVFGDATSPATMSTSAASFFNAADAGQGSGQPSAALFSTMPTLQWDTWVGIDSNFIFTSPGFPNIASAGGGASVTGNTNLAWFVVSGTPTATGSVVIGQFAVAEGSSLEVNVSINLMRSGTPLTYRDLHYSFGAPPSTGACCIQGVCSSMTEKDCAAAGGVFSGVGIECAAVQCDLPPQTGACCIVGTCAEMTAAQCALAGGTYSGDGSSCGDVNCSPPDPTGACCVMGQCAEMTEASCTAVGGTFWGVGTDCGSVNCQPPPTTGACCVEGECVEVTEEICALLGSVGGSVFHGVGSTCGSVSCDAPPEPTGACCIAGTCVELTEAACAAAMGTYSGPNTSCGDVVCQPPPAQTGACCVAGGCSQKTAQDCTAAGGSFSGDGSLCDQVDCPMPAAVGTGGGFAFWKTATPRDRNYSHWPAQFHPDDALSAVFNLPQCISDSSVRNATLLDALQFGGGSGVNGGAKLLLRSAVAALLDAQLTQNGVCNAAYPLMNAQNVIAIVNDGLATCDRDAMMHLEQILNSYNNLRTPINSRGECMP